MNARYQNDVQEWFEEAAHDGPILPPKVLIDVLGKGKADWLHLVNDGVYEAFSKFHHEFPEVAKARYYRLEPHEKDKIVALLRWFKLPLEITAKKHNHKAIGVVHLLIGACFGRGSFFWNNSEISFGQKDNLAKFASKILSGMMFSFSVPLDTPLYERDLLEQWDKARREHNFITIGRLLRSFENLCHPPTVMEQAVFCLQANAPKRLLHVVNSCNNPMTAWMLAELLSPSIRLLLSEKTRNIWFMFFGVLYGGFGEERRRDISVDIQRQLVKCLLRASKNVQFWKQLIFVLNEHAYRYPDMQKSLGTALAKASKTAISIYAETLSIKLDSIDSHIPNEADGIETCIGSFVACASKRRKKVLLELLYAQWVNFINSPKLRTDESHTIKLFRTNIDCAVSCYLKNYFKKIHIHTLIKDSADRLNTFKNIWHVGAVEADKLLTIELCKINVYYSALIDDVPRFFERPFPFRTPAFLLESAYMQHIFPHQLDELIRLARNGVQTANVPLV